MGLTFSLRAMFTGLIEAVGRVEEVKPLTAGVKFDVHSVIAEKLHSGDSIAVSGVCLTVTSVRGDRLEADVSPETLQSTSLGRLHIGDLVNLERPLQAKSRFGGHFVQGHVDATGTISQLRSQGDFYLLTVTFPEILSPYLVLKGSVAVDGISLTISEINGNRFSTQIIPYTWENTNLRVAKTGDSVNLESDILGKYVVRLMQQDALNTTHC